MKHSSNAFKYLPAAVLVVLVAWMIYPQPVRGQTHTQKPWQDLPPKQFHQIMQTNPEAIIIDTRMLPKYERERIPGAHPAPYSDELKALTDTISPKTPLLIYCGADERSTTVCEMLTEEMGFTNVFRLKGGLYRWQKQNLPLDQSSVEAGS